MIKTAQIVCWQCKRGEFQLFNLKDDNGKKTEDYICRVCKEIYGMMRPKIGNVSKIYIKDKEVKIVDGEKKS